MKNKRFKRLIAACLVCISCVSFCSCGSNEDVNKISSDMETITETYNSFKKSKERNDKLELYKSMKTVTKGKLSKSEQKEYSSFLIDMNDYFINDYNKTLIQVEMVINEQGELGKNQDKDLVKEQYTILSDFKNRIEKEEICTDEQLGDYKKKIDDLNSKLQLIQKNSGVVDEDKKKQIMTIALGTGIPAERQYTTAFKYTTGTTAATTTADPNATTTTKATVTSTAAPQTKPSSTQAPVTEAPKSSEPPAVQETAAPESPQEQNQPTEAAPSEPDSTENNQN